MVRGTDARSEDILSKVTELYLAQKSRATICKLISEAYDISWQAVDAYIHKAKNKVLPEVVADRKKYVAGELRKLEGKAQHLEEQDKWQLAAKYRDMMYKIQGVYAEKIESDVKIVLDFGDGDTDTDS